MSNTQIKVKKATIEDITTILEITTKAFEKYVTTLGLSDNITALKESIEDIKNDITTKEVFIAYIGNTPVGSARIEIVKDGTAYLSRYGVKPEYQSMGVGKVLMDQIDTVMIQHQIKKVFLHTASKHVSLMQFYYSRGFYVDSTTKDKGYIRALMCKEYS